MLKRCLMPLLVAVLLGAAGCTPGQRADLRGEQSKRDIYLNLMTDDEAAHFLEMEREWADDERMLLYCQEVGAYQAWRATPPERQALIRKRQVEVGMTADEVRMAWGPPADVEQVTSAAEQAEGHGRELWRWDPFSDPQGEMFLREASLLDGQLQWFKDFRDKSVWKKMRFWER